MRLRDVLYVVWMTVYYAATAVIILAVILFFLNGIMQAHHPDPERGCVGGEQVVGAC